MEKIDNLIKQLRTPQVIRPRDDLFKQLVTLHFDEMYYVIDMLKKCNIKLDGDDTCGYVTSVINK